ncbi:MAG: hypothetical protein BWY76_02868 [bacterium ADurb.Bin429]|nr:MAG: hypothetical protein BWY76_02868 [bacterium ADurb.Bin429]
MSRVRALSAMICIVLLAALAPSAWAGDAEEQRQTAMRFLQAYVRQDIATVRNYVPTSLEAMFGAYPFTAPYTLARPKVDDGQALVEFTGKVADRNLPPKGGVLMRREGDDWKVRQIIFYDNVPRLLNLPSRSVTNADRGQEPAVKAVAQHFLEAWRRKDAARMDELTYKWQMVNKDPIKGLSLTKITMSNSTTTGGEPLVKYSAKITYRFGILSYSMDFKGGLVMVKHNGDWKVRGSLLLFDF